MVLSLLCLAYADDSALTEPADNSAQAADIPVLQAETVTATADGTESITIRANVRKVAVYLNGNYEGNTTLTLRNLVRGQYHLHLEKSGYHSADYMIAVTQGCAQTYFIALEK